MHRRSLLVLAAGLAVGGLITSCSDDGDPAPEPGGIYGPARVGTDSGADNSDGGADD